MDPLRGLREGVNEAWESLVEGWQRLYRQASGAITRFRSGASEPETVHEMERRSAGWGILAAEVFDDHDKVVVRLEVPGLDPNDFQLEVVEGTLVVSGHKRIERERTEGEYRISECAYGSFARRMPLPDEVDASRAAARYRQGVLRVELPKTGRGRRRRIDVKAG